MFVDDSFFAVILAWSNKKREFRYLCDLISSKSTNINHNTKIDNPFLKKKRDYISHTIPSTPYKIELSFFIKT